MDTMTPTPESTLPPPPTPKKSHLGGWIIAALVVLGVVALASGGDSSGTPGGITDETKITAVTDHRVKYKLSGTTDMASITYSLGDNDTQQQSDIDVPLRRKSDQGEGIQFRANRGAFLYIAAQNSRNHGSITCTIEVDGIPVKTNTSSGGYTIATCSGRL